MKPSAIAVLFSSFLAAAGLVALAGPLNPPAGPVAPSYKTLTEVEPRIAINTANTPGDADSVYRIVQPGSYYLTENLTGAVGKRGIEIAASDVTIDLMGFELRGIAGSLDGIASSVLNLTGVSLANGTISSWGNSGVDFNTSSTNSARLTDVTSTANGQLGFALGSQVVLSNCIAVSNLGGGFLAGTSSILNACSARSNTGTGMNIGLGSSATDCTANANTGTGIIGGSGCTVRGCATYFNQSDGISVNNGSLVAHTSNLGNSNNGIRVTFGVAVLDNTCRQNGNGTGSGAGILVTGSDCRIEGNTCSITDRGIEVTGTGNLIVGNACASNTTDWIIAANNVYGPIIDRRAPASAAVNGFFAASVLGTTEPNANFSY